MGSAASKQFGRNLAKNVGEKSLNSSLKRTKVDPLAGIQKQMEHQKQVEHQPQANQNYVDPRLHNRGQPPVRGPTNRSGQPLTHGGRSKPDYSKKDGMDPDFNAKAMSLGAVKLYEKDIKIDRNNQAIQTLNRRQEYEQLGKQLKYQVENRTLLDPRTIAAILNDYDAGCSVDQLVKRYALHPDFLNQLGLGIVKVAKTRISNAKTIDDVDFKNHGNQRHAQDNIAPQRNKKQSSELQDQLDKLLS